jgi:hypothetical protein
MQEESARENDEFDIADVLFERAKGSGFAAHMGLEFVSRL